MEPSLVWDSYSVIPTTPGLSVLEPDRGRQILLLLTALDSWKVLISEQWTAKYLLIILESPSNLPTSTAHPAGR